MSLDEPPVCAGHQTGSCLRLPDPCLRSLGRSFSDEHIPPGQSSGWAEANCRSYQACASRRKRASAPVPPLLGAPSTGAPSYAGVAQHGRRGWSSPSGLSRPWTPSTRWLDLCSHTASTRSPSFLTTRMEPLKSGSCAVPVGSFWPDGAADLPFRPLGPRCLRAHLSRVKGAAHRCATGLRPALDPRASVRPLAGKAAGQGSARADARPHPPDEPTSRNPPTGTAGDPQIDVWHTVDRGAGAEHERRHLCGGRRLEQGPQVLDVLAVVG